jgi:predicted O-methyltransferase YrrM
MEKNIAGELTQRSRLEHDIDRDLYEPTKAALEAVLPRLTAGSVLVFDELNHPEYPGETQAVQEVLGVNRLRLRRSPNLTFGSWAVFGE